VASHARSHTTAAEHRPKSHQRYLAWTPSRIVEWGQTAGPLTAELLERIMASKCRPEQKQRVEAVARRALDHRTYSYPSVYSMLR
jgi:hypothetical protein